MSGLLEQAGAERSSCEKLGLGPATREQPAVLEAGNALLRLPGGGRPQAGGEELRGLASLCCSQTWLCPSARAGLQHGFFWGGGEGREQAEWGEKVCVFLFFSSFFPPSVLVLHIAVPAGDGFVAGIKAVVLMFCAFER